MTGAHDSGEEWPDRRDLESSMAVDDQAALGYVDYLGLDTLLASQHPRSDHDDELLFIIQHQVTELWFTLVLHELGRARDHLDADDLPRALKNLDRVKQIQRTLSEQWSVLATLTPVEFAGFRRLLYRSSGFHSAQYRCVEFLLGNKNADLLAVFDGDQKARARLERYLDEPTLYDAFLRHLARAGLRVPADVVGRDVRRPWAFRPDLVPLFQCVYEDVGSHWDLYRGCEALVDLEDNFQEWRFRHLRTVARTIAAKPGTAGSTGLHFLRKALDLTFFPELFVVRNEIG